MRLVETRALSTLPNASPSVPSSAHLWSTLLSVRPCKSRLGSVGLSRSKRLSPVESCGSEVGLAGNVKKRTQAARLSGHESFQGKCDLRK